MKRAAKQKNVNENSFQAQQRITNVIKLEEIFPSLLLERKWTFSAVFFFFFLMQEELDFNDSKKHCNSFEVHLKQVQDAGFCYMNPISTFLTSFCI